MEFRKLHQVIILIQLQVRDISGKENQKIISAVASCHKKDFSVTASYLIFNWTFWPIYSWWWLVTRNAIDIYSITYILKRSNYNPEKKLTNFTMDSRSKENLLGNLITFFLFLNWPFLYFSESFSCTINCDALLTQEDVICFLRCLEI